MLLTEISRRYINPSFKSTITSLTEIHSLPNISVACREYKRLRFLILRASRDIFDQAHKTHTAIAFTYSQPFLLSALNNRFLYLFFLMYPDSFTEVSIDNKVIAIQSISNL